jgi:hypothetical protein
MVQMHVRTHRPSGRPVSLENLGRVIARGSPARRDEANANGVVLGDRLLDEIDYVALKTLFSRARSVKNGSRFNSLGFGHCFKHLFHLFGSHIITSRQATIAA